MACNRLVGTENAYAVMERYARAAMTYGDCLAVLVPPQADGFEAASIAARLDGLLLTGSPSNVGPVLYGDDSEGEGPFDAGRDHVSFALSEAMIAKGRPVFGICRGFQELNVLMGGSLRRDVGLREGNGLSHHAPDGATLPEMFEHYHDVELKSGGVLSKAYGGNHLRVNSVHYQGVDRLGAGLSVEAVASDGLIEAFSANISGAQVLAVQWHPEWEPEKHPESQTYFHLMGRALRGEAVV